MRTSKTARSNNEEFISRAKEMYGDKYTYEKVNYINNRTPVIITCPIHGDFEKKPSKFLHRKQACPKCSTCYHPTTEEWIERAKEKFGNKFDYSKVIYKSNKDDVIIICPEHGEFKISPKEHIKSTMGCPECYKQSRLSSDNFLDYFKEKHGDRFDYSKSVYNGAHNDIIVTCRKHGDFAVTPTNHIIRDNGGCFKCSCNYSPTTEEWIERSMAVHGDKYDYTKSEYKTANDTTIITCPIHGDFEIVARQHTRGQGCPKCSHTISKQEMELHEYIRSILDKNIDIITNNREVLGGKEIDIYIPSKKIGIEYDGLYWHSDAIRDDKEHLLYKTKLCEDDGIRLIHIYADEWLMKKDICKSRLRSILGCIENRVYGRKCNVKSISYNEIKDFLNENHIQGSVISKYNYGLYYNNELLSVMSFGGLRKNLGSKHKDGVYEMLRFCNKLGYNVIGGAGKLLSYFIKDVKPLEIISYADRRWSDGNLYKKLGFDFVRDTDVNYYYIVDNMRKNRFGFRKDVLISKYGCPKDMTEKEFCISKGWYRVYDCGCKLYSMKIK